jgi:uncharacterized protein with gpF-like domain
MKTLKPIRPNKGIETRYQRKLESIIEKMIDSYSFWLTAAYRKNPPKMALDALPSRTAEQYLKELGDQWQKNFDEVMEAMVDTMVFGQIKMTDTTMRNLLKDAGWSVEFKMTRAMQDMARATISEHVGLIKSIPEQFHFKVEGAVMRGYAQGHDLFTIRKELQEIYDVTKNRASFIARDQVSKLNSQTTKARQQELGLTQAIWLHSAGGRKPRLSHVNASGKTYDVEKGMYLDGEWIHPGYLINCRCSSRIILPT